MDTNTDSTKDIMANSRLEITNADFNKLVLNKIMKKQKSKLIISHVVFYLLILAATIAFIIIRANGIDSLADIILNNIVELGAWFINYEFIFIPFFILLVIKSIIDIRLHHRINS